MRDGGPWEYFGYELPVWVVVHLAPRSPEAINDKIKARLLSDRYTTLLHLAVERGVSETEIENMILLGAKLKATDSEGFTPVQLAWKKQANKGWPSNSFPETRIACLLDWFLMRHDCCRASCRALWTSLRRQGLCKDVVRLLVKELWAQRHNRYWGWKK